MKAIGLFSEPFDLDEIERALNKDDFFSLAFLVLGFELSWRKALHQVAALLSIYEDADRDHRPIYRMVAVLIQRAETFDDTGKYLDEITTTLGFLPGTQYMQEIKMAHLHKIDPQAWQRKKNQEWVENYKANMTILRSAEMARSQTPGA